MGVSVASPHAMAWNTSTGSPFTAPHSRRPLATVQARESPTTSTRWARVRGTVIGVTGGGTATLPAGCRGAGAAVVGGGRVVGGGGIDVGGAGSGTATGAVTVAC